jgi:hypothetical protein
MSLDRVVSRMVTASDRSRFFTAICLYEFQVAILYPKSFKKLLEATDLSERGPSKVLRRARIYAAIRILEHLESEAKRDGQPIGLQKVTPSGEYAKLYDEIVVANGGWKQIRYMPSIKTFERNLAKRTRRAKTVGKCIDFSFRFSTIPDTGRYKGGVSSARRVVARAKYYEVNRKSSTVKNRWREFKSTSAFAYLSLVEELLPRPKLTKRSFVESLLKAADDKRLRAFFRSYQQLDEALSPRNYAFAPLRLDLGKEKFLNARPFDGTDVLEIWEKTKDRAE